MAPKSAAKSFQLPALNIESSSLTAGTSIPAPPPSPPPKVSNSSKAPLRKPVASPARVTAYAAASPPRTPNVGPPSSANPHHLSPAPSAASTAATHPKRTSTAVDSSASPPAKRPLSVRRFLGLRSLSGAFARGGSSDGVYANGGGGGRSTDKLSLFSQARPESQASNSRPSLRKKRSTLMMLGRRSSAFFGASVEEEEEAVEEKQEEYDTRPTANGNDVESLKNTTPPPSLPGLDGLKASRGLHDREGGYLGGGDMFRNIG